MTDDLDPVAMAMRMHEVQLDRANRLESERDALRAELATLHATDDYQRWARAVTERDAARAEVERLREKARHHPVSDERLQQMHDRAAQQPQSRVWSMVHQLAHEVQNERDAIARVEALCDDLAAYADDWLSRKSDSIAAQTLAEAVAKIRAALAGPGEPTAVPPTLPMTPLTDEENRRILYAIDHSGEADTGPGATT